MEKITKKEIRAILPKRHTESHKGQNGRVLIIGGSIDYYGAPILAGLAALGGGADLVHLLVPECNFEISRSYYPDFIVHKYAGNFLNSRALDTALKITEKCDSTLLGPGLGDHEETIRTVAQIVERSQRPAVLDADAIAALIIMQQKRELNITITPHRGEFQKLTGTVLNTDIEIGAKAVSSYANDSGITILLKGPTDIVAGANGNTSINTTGNAGLTVGGTGDTLAGLIASLLAQKIAAFEACEIAAFILGTAGDTLYKQKGFGFTATDVALEIPYTTAKL